MRLVRQGEKSKAHAPKRGIQAQAVLVGENSLCFTATPIESADTSLVIVTGPFELSDVDQFKNITGPIPKAIVLFGSDGGNLVAGLEIGEAIRLKNYTSVVPDGARCASTCALAWLAVQNA
jgi:hypothetical protein